MRVVQLFRALILILLCSGTAGATGADTRIALVIGIGSYQFTPELPTAETDARALATALRRNGFDVEEAYDLDDWAFTSRLRDFGARASTADEAIIFRGNHLPRQSSSMPTTPCRRAGRTTCCRPMPGWSASAT